MTQHAVDLINNQRCNKFTMLNPTAVMIHIVTKTFVSKTRATIVRNEKLMIFFCN